MVASIPWFVNTLEEISEPIERLLLISHGGSGYLDFDNEALSVFNLEQLDRVRLGTFARNAQIFLVGCEVSSKPDGEYFLLRLTEKLLRGSGGSVTGCDRPNFTINFPWGWWGGTSDLRSMPRATWKTVSISAAGKIIGTKKFAHLNYSTMEKTLSNLDTFIPKLISADKKTKTLAYLADAKNAYKLVKENDYDSLLDIARRIELISRIVSTDMALEVIPPLGG